jgi:hypothetical protein
MEITTIKFIVNLTNRPLLVSNPRTGENTDGFMPAQSTRSINTSVELCSNQHEFDQSHRIEARLWIFNGEDIVFALWQQAREDGDYVRASRNLELPVFDPSAAPVPTTNNGALAGGDRVLVIVDDWTIRLEVLGL